MANLVRGIANVIGQQGQTLDQFVSDVLQWGGPWDQFVNNWKYRDVCKILQKQASQINSVLSGHLDFRQHSLAASYLLGFKAGLEKWDDQSRTLYLNQIRQFIQEADPRQISLAPRAFSDTFRFWSDFWKDKGLSIEMIEPIKSSIRLLQHDNRNLLTVAHPDLMYCCVKSYCYHQAFPEIQQDIIQVQGDGCIRSIDNLRFHYYSGMVYIGLKKYREALECLTMVCSAPSEVLSVVQIEAYKKYILISLILNQKLVSLPRYTPRNLLRHYSKAASEYLEIASMFSSRSGGSGESDTMYQSEVVTVMEDEKEEKVEGGSSVTPQSSNKIEQLNRIIEKHQTLFFQDKNVGLMKQVMFSLRKDAVRKLTSVYTRVSLQKVTALCKFENDKESKYILMKMIEQGDLSASFDKDGVVTFKDSMSDSDRNMLVKVQEKIESMAKLWDGLDKAQLKMKQDEKLLKKALNIPNEEMQQQILIQNPMSGNRGFNIP